MKMLPLVVLLAVALPNVIHAEDSEEGTLTAMKYAAGYAGTKLKDTGITLRNGADDIAYAIATAVKDKSNAAWGYAQDVGDGWDKWRAKSNGDGVEINANVYSLALRQAIRDNTALTKLQKDRVERLRDLEKAQAATKDLQGLAKDYKEDASNFQKNIGATLVGIAEQAKKLKGWDEAHQKKLEYFVDEHKKIGKLTAEDGAARTGQHALVSMKDTWSSLEDFIKKSPDEARALGLDVRFKSMSSLLEGATKEIGQKEEALMKTMAKINELAKVDEKSVADDEETMKRQMILGTLNNSVNNLITSAEFSKNRSQLAFSHFNDIEATMKDKGVKKGDVKDTYKKNAQSLAAQYNETPFGLYVNGQIAKAMGTVCDLVANQCKDGSNSALFDFLDDSSRFQLKLSPVDGTSGTVEKGAAK